MKNQEELPLRMTDVSTMRFEPCKDITAFELARATPLIMALACDPFNVIPKVQMFKALPEEVQRHFSYKLTGC